jgi:HNH endonuclease
MAEEELDIAAEALETANSDLCPERLTVERARELLGRYARIRRLAEFGLATLSPKLGDPGGLAQATGTSMATAKEVTATGKVLATSEDLSAAFRHGDISLDQAAAIASAEESSPGAGKELLEVAATESFHVLKDRARKLKLEAEQHRDLASRQRAARSARSYADELGMTHIHLALEPHVGTPIVARAETEAARLARAARDASGDGSGTRSEGPGACVGIGGDDDGATEPFERYLADAYAALLSGSGKGSARRPELVVLVSHEIIARGWKDVREGEHCKIPGVGPVSPATARAIAKDAFLNGVFCDGKDLRHFKRWGRHIPVEVLIALELGEPPSFDGVACTDCGNRFHTEFDHVTPRFAHVPTSRANLQPRCWRCHQAKSKRERKVNVLKPPEP